MHYFPALAANAAPAELLLNCLLQVLLRVPGSLCLTIDYASGASLPGAAWPRLRQGLAKAEPLTWDLLLVRTGTPLRPPLGAHRRRQPRRSVCLCHPGACSAGRGGWGWGPLLGSLCERGAAGAGGADGALLLAGRAARWAALPRHSQRRPCATGEGTTCKLSPSCCTLAYLCAKAHARRFRVPPLQARLRALFPGLAQEEGGAAPGWLRWAFACVRSRAFRLGPERYAFVPFLDAANHAAQPRAAYSEAGGAVELVALAGGLAPGEQVTVSYSGGRGCARGLCWPAVLACSGRGALKGSMCAAVPARPNLHLAATKCKATLCC